MPPAVPPCGGGLYRSGRPQGAPLQKGFPVPWAGGVYRGLWVRGPGARLNEVPKPPLFGGRFL